MSKPKQRTNWYAIAAWIVCPAATWAVIIFVALALFCSCATEHNVYDHHTHTATADTLGMELVADARMQVAKDYADSLFAAYTEKFSMELRHNFQEQEVTTETITTAIDSLGRTLRTEQRTTTRTASHEEQQRVQQIVSDLRTEFHQRILSYDSLWQQRLALTQTHWEDSLAALRTEATKSNTPAKSSPLQRLWSWLQGAVVGAILALGLWFSRKWWLGIFKR